jgi:hypothetical protein
MYVHVENDEIVSNYYCLKKTQREKN